MAKEGMKGSHASRRKGEKRASRGNSPINSGSSFETAFSNLMRRKGERKNEEKEVDGEKEAL